MSANGGDRNPNDTITSFTNPLAIPELISNTGSLHSLGKIINPTNKALIGLCRVLVASRQPLHTAVLQLGSDVRILIQANSWNLCG